jgi:hypothetical protein
VGTNDKAWHIFRFKISIELPLLLNFSKEKKKKKKVVLQVKVSRKASFFKKILPVFMG